jgi:hypothetical protein
MVFVIQFRFECYILFRFVSTSLEVLVVVKLFDVTEGAEGICIFLSHNMVLFLIF